MLIQVELMLWITQEQTEVTIKEPTSMVLNLISEMELTDKQSMHSDNQLMHKELTDKELTDKEQMDKELMDKEQMDKEIFLQTSAWEMMYVKWN